MYSCRTIEIINNLCSSRNLLKYIDKAIAIRDKNSGLFEESITKMNYKVDVYSKIKKSGYSINKKNRTFFEKLAEDKKRYMKREISSLVTKSCKESSREESFCEIADYIKSFDENDITEMFNLGDVLNLFIVTQEIDPKG